MTQTLLPLGKIRTDGDTQPRVAMAQDVVDDYAEILRSGQELPPLTVFWDTQHYWLASGFHRLAAARLAGRSHYPCEVRHGGVAEARLFAAATNARHGLRRSHADKRRAVHLVLQDSSGKDWSAEKVATHCGVSVSLVKAIKQSTPWAPTPSPQLGLFGVILDNSPPAPDFALLSDSSVASVEPPGKSVDSVGFAATQDQAVVCGDSVNPDAMEASQDAETLSKQAWRTCRKLKRIADLLETTPEALLLEHLEEVDS